MPQNLRKWISLISAVIIYYIIHEGAHLVFGLIYGTFERVRFFYGGLGVQVVVNTAVMTNMQILILNIAGVTATLIVAYLLVWRAKAIAGGGNKLLRAIGYYTTLVFLLLDPIYLSVIHNFVGGGDMNGIAVMGWSTVAASVVFGVIALINLVVFIKAVYPYYKKSFSAD